MQIEMRASHSGPEGRFRVGHVYDVPEPLARQFIDRGAAVVATPAKVFPIEEKRVTPTPIERLEVDAFVIKKLVDAGLTTVEKLRAFIDEGYDLTEITGIGISRAEEITEALKD